MHRLAWVTAREARGTDVDEPLALAALAAAGARVDVVEWDDPRADWAGYDRVVLRSPWDYDDRLAEFLAWADGVAAVSDLRNPVDMVRWSTDKHYLAELQEAGLPVIPTEFVEPGQQPRFPGGGVVVKPAVGAGSRDVVVYGPDGSRTDAAAHVARLHATGVSALVQPLLRSVALDGEWPLLFFGGRYSHAASKRVALPEGRPTSELYAPEATAPHDASGDQRAVAEAAVAVVTRRFGAPTYARIDLVRDDDGQFRVLEVELVEPSLFLPEGGPQAVARLVEALLAP
ncbi:MAG TPA: hypothetical protein VFR07_18930 [Mycobacteriales bacterium]|jgi:glutathione synthase/RimK-type ligase-like ATP-grasp enzyme|nr:hypothetical protein [Mycobacteriales bacterium]